MPKLCVAFECRDNYAVFQKKEEERNRWKDAMTNDRKTFLNRKYLKVPKCINVLIVGHLKQRLFFTRTIVPIVFDKFEHVWPTKLRYLDVRCICY